MSDMLSLEHNYYESLPETLFLLFIAFFFGVLFMQSGLDKVLNFDDNLTFLKTHFQKTIFKNNVSILFIVLTIFELFTGSIFCVGLAGVLIFGFSNQLIHLLFLGVIMSNLTLCCLFLGQRMARDYVGAVNLATYFLIALLSLFFFF